MKKLGLVISSVALDSALTACGGGHTSAESSPLTPAMLFDVSFTLPDNLPKDTIREELPSEGVGSRKDPTWGKVGGFTQTTKAQVLAFPSGMTVTIRNLSKSISHKLDVVGKAGAPIAETGKDGYREAHTTFVYVLDAKGRLTKTMLASMNLADGIVDAVAFPKVAAR